VLVHLFLRRVEQLEMEVPWIQKELLKEPLYVCKENYRSAVLYDVAHTTGEWGVLNALSTSTALFFYYWTEHLSLSEHIE
jgi:hypothetical protein